MIHKNEKIVNCHYLNNEASLKRSMANEIINSISDEEFDKLFKFKKIDPENRDDILEFNDDEYERVLNNLRERQCVLFVLKLLIK
jgi:hypothetical protein